jgi:hypothetical protein
MPSLFYLLLFRKELSSLHQTGESIEGSECGNLSLAHNILK